ncbi:MAG TPA: hypothetical protein ENI23_10735 [bacterium]|nr:hypothetical protein [bacterium]
MSQFGAYGAALKGWTAQNIVTFYYTQTQVQTRSGTIHVTGNTSLEGYVNKTISYDQYVAGLGEVPDKACGTAAQAAANPSKYRADNPNTIWDCWPAEAIKAQVIAARSYAASNGGAICTSAACQVYKGGNGKKWAADETSNQVIVSTGSTHNGKIIRALYSSDNNQGYGTADNDTRFSSFSGVGTPFSYLRHVNDTKIAASYSYTNWTWRTNSYTYAEIDQMLTWVAGNYTLSSNPPYAASVRSFVGGLHSSVGTVTSLSFVRDGSNRVKQVKVTGTKGTKVISGWLFKSVWNSWIYNVAPSGEKDYIYSLTWFLLTG